MGRRAPRAAAWLAAGFGPYLLFDLLFQETFTGRYALPLVVPMAYLAVEGVRRLPRRSGVVVAIAIAMYSAHIGGTSIAAYSRQQAPAFQLLDDMRTVARSLTEAPVLAMDRRESLDFRRPIAWLGAGMRVSRTLAAPPQHEWLEAVNYWNSGGVAAVWFVVDPKRSSIELVQHGPPAEYRWSLPYPTLLSGIRPNEMDWYRVDQPDWYVGEGWSLTPESAGVAERDGRGLQNGAITAWIKVRDGMPGALLIGGRNLEPALRPTITIRVAGTRVDEWTVLPGFFLRSVVLPSKVDPDRPFRYLPIEVASEPPSRVAIEQFDTSLTRPLTGFGDGWYEPEFNPETGRRWRWLSERGQIRVVPATAVGPLPVGRLRLHLEGESPRKYFSHASNLVVRAGDQTLFDAPVADDFALDIPIPNGIDSIVLQTDQVFTPADRSRRTADRRHLGLRIFKCEVREAGR